MFFFNSEIGASDNPCTNTFAGPSPFSEPEARAVADYVMTLNNQGRFIYYFGLHSFTQLIVVPYSHITAEESANLTNYADMVSTNNLMDAYLLKAQSKIFKSLHYENNDL